MSVSTLRPWRIVGILSAAGLLSHAGTALAQPPQPIQPKPQAPVLAAPVFPLGMQRGTTLEVTLTGSNLAAPIAVWTSIPGAKAEIPADGNNGKDNARLRVRLDVPKDAPLGFHSLRLATARGMSNFQLFCVDDLPQVLQQETNRNKATPQPLPVPCVVVGRVNAEASDWYRITAAAGQRLSFDVLGRRLGSAFDPQLTLYDAKTGKELSGGYSNDAPGCQTDPRLTYTFKDAGDYLVEIRDVQYRGGPDFFYRLRVGDFPCATTPLPMAARRGGKVAVRFAGSQVEGVAPVEVSVPTDPTVDTVWVAPQGPSGLHGWPVALAVSDLDEVLEQEPNDEPAKANRVPVPGGVTGRFEQKGDRDHFIFAAKKGQRYVIEAHTQDLYSPTEVYLVLKDAKGAQVAASNPMAAPRIEYAAPADGDLVLLVEHLLYWGGPAESYRVTITPAEPSFALDLRLDRWDAPQGGFVNIPVMLAARNGYAGPIEVSVVGPPGISGQATIPAGQAPVPPAPQPAVPSVMLPVRVNPDVPMGAYGLLIQGKAQINGKTVVEYASVRTVASQSLAGLAFPPRTVLHQVGFAVTEKPPFTLAFRFDLPEFLRGGPATATVTATRDPGYAEEIALSAQGLPPNVAPALKNIPKGQNEVKVQFNVAANAPLGQFQVSLAGATKYQGKDFSVTTPTVPLVLSLPFALTVEPASLKVFQGSKARLKIQAVRKGGYQGPIALEVRNLPQNVTAPKATIPDGQQAVEIDIAAAPQAAAGSKADVNVLGIALAAANQQNASPNLTLIVAAPPPPFELKVEPAALALAPGGKIKLKVTVVRHGYTGAIAVEVRNLPANVTAPRVVIPAGQDGAEIELTAAPNAVLGDKPDVQVVGVAVAESASPKIKVSVQMK